MKNQIKNTHREARQSTKTIKVMVMFIFFSLVLIGSVSAVEWNDKLTYSNNDLKISLDNWWGHGKTIGTAELKSHKSVDEIRGVKLGESVVMWYDFDDFSDLYVNGLGDVEIINLDTGQIIQKNYTFVYWGNETYQVSNNVCNNVLDQNGTIGNVCSQSGTKNQTREGWLPYNSRDIPKGKITIGLEINMIMDETLDIIWEIGGKKIEKHAVVSSGSIETTEGLFTILTFNNNGTFNTTEDINISYLVVAGGGGGGVVFQNNAPGGGGAGGVNNSTSFNLVTANYVITVGGGGIGGVPQTTTATNGTNSSIGSVVIAVGGGAGGSSEIPISDGGSGSGGFAGNGGLGIALQGNDGGDGVSNGGGGGGGAGVAGSDGDGTNGGNAGNGRGNNILNGTTIFYAGGGGGGSRAGTAGIGGTGGGGDGGTATGNGDNGIANTGGGGGGGGSQVSGEGNGGAGGSGIVIIRFLTPGPTINLDAPANNTNFTLTNNVVMNATIFDDTNITNVTLYLNDVGNETNSTSGLNNTVWTFTKNMGQGDTFWTMEACNFNNVCVNASQRVFSVDTILPALDVFFPNETLTFHELNTPLFVNWSVNDSNLDACVLEFQGVNVTQTCSDNQTTIDINNSINRSLTFYTNDTFGNLNASSVSWNYVIVSNVQDFNTTSFETELNNFTINITYNSTEFTNIDTNLYYNSTRHPTTQTGATDDINFSITLSRLFVAPNTKPFFWNFRVTNATGLFDINSTEKTQVEQPILFALCNSTLTTPYVNFTFKDEGNLSLLNASVPTSTFVHTLGNFTVNKTLTFIDTSEEFNFTFCLDPPNRTLRSAFSFQYEKVGYQQRVIEFAQTWNSTLTTNVLFLLSNADGLFVTFQVINTAEQTLANVIINATRIIDSIETIVGTGVTNDAGTKTFFLNPNFLHTIRAFKTGFPQFTTSLFPDQTAFTINLGGTAAGGEEDFTQGITVDIFPKGSLLIPNQSTVFNFTLTSNFFTVEEFSFGLRDENGNIFDNQTASTNGGTISTTLNTSNNLTIIMDYNWKITGNFTNNSRSWLIFNDTVDNEFSVKIIFSDLTAFIDSGLFGIDDFGLAIITFLIIFLFTGVMSARFGLASPAAVTTLMFTLVLFFDVGLGLMDNLNPVGAIPNFPTVIMGIMLAGVLMKDGIR